MNYALIASLSVVGLFFGMLLAAELGRRIGTARLAVDPDGLAKGAAAAEAALFGLLGLMLAFTFSGAASRLQDRKQLIVAEANAIGTAYLRLDLLPSDAQLEIKALVRRYLEVRSTTYLDVQDQAATEAALAEATVMQMEIWTKSVAATRRPDASAQAAILLLPALNEMIDLTTTRTMATRNHLPLVVFLLLGGLSLVSALLVGYDTSPNQERSWFHTMVFSAILTLTVYVTIDLEFPRVGLIRVDSADQLLIDLHRSMR